MFKTKKDQPVAKPEQDRYTSGEVARIAGVSLRQLQWWDERSVVSPRQEGHRRVYLQQEVVEVSGGVLDCRVYFPDILFDSVHAVAQIF